MYAKHRHAWIYRSIRACHAEALAKAGPLACLVGKTFPRFGCIALRAYLFSATDAGSFKSATGRIRRGEPGATPQGNVAREDERCRRESATVQMNRAFSASRALFTGEPGALPQAHVTIAPLALNRYNSPAITSMSVSGRLICRFNVLTIQRCNVSASLVQLLYEQPD